MELKLLKVIRESNGNIKYSVESQSDKSKIEVTAAQIVSVIKQGKATFTNLKLDSEDKIILSDDIEFEDKYIDPMAKLLNEVKDAESKVNNLGSLNTDEKVDLVKDLVKVLKECSKAYYSEIEVIDNILYDKLYDALVVLESETGLVLPDSPSVTVEYETQSGLEKRKHSTKMLSLGKTKSLDELKEFLQDKEGVLSYKNDGLTIVLEYNSGELVEAITRGNGEVGELVTVNARQFRNIPSKTKFKGYLKLRGEAVITLSDFAKIKGTPEGEEYKNARNLCSGTVRQLNSKIVADRGVKWFAFNIVEFDDPSGEIELPNEADEQLKLLKSFGFETVDYEVVNSKNIEGIVERLTEKVRNEQYDIPVDGLVLTFRDTAYGKSLGNTAKTPRHSIAFKWEDTISESKMIDVVWQTSRQGLITPVAVFEPTDVEGSTITRATLHNVSIFESLELGKGDTIGVYKANMIIPKVAYNKTRSNTFTVPCTCANCGEKASIKVEAKSGVRTLWCLNPNCDTRANKKLEHFVKRDAMNIVGISSATIETLVDCGFLDTFSSFYSLDDYRLEMEMLDGFGEASVTKLLDAIETSRKVKLSNLIFALGIPNIGITTAKLICKTITTPIEVVQASYSDLMSIDGIGETIAMSFVDYFTVEENLKEFANLIGEVELQPEMEQLDASLAGLTFCVTGSVERFSSRRQVKELIEKLGGKLTSAVSKSTSYLVTNDTTSGSAKNKAAKANGVETLTENEFINKFNLEQYL